ncbi:Nucleoside 2-deoxyribosyltransferase [Streptoalloteichus tenebrarius]|uniref:Nucleoside 2-deoxyribosyltransferase n=1 Tax=Streptoalloteichus tenebrarius (strain ATCC 17920 / DSM 40477 / JCM 4838 / CBS 697.72 / NBRC 16177 / NCIMB 11028 / NRRL B-12390 / A12253. 1 / ISP 5477) TaxID=1933 RepID=A0ABT1HRL3_STRSD|nr:nucleoside 2-deoxyribosyltransferase [Streptoalloteichus tenebrarius]MCP2258154.1 Nucleoside 2-deoxyribosyltransferase [Streptoalloteichus tenebrarius]BFF04619.1 hypothetical protein GCM10020241_62940 [Streptoalloteichus tenebrarius]
MPDRDASAPTVFIGGPFKGCVDPLTGEIDPAVRRRYERLITFFRERGWTVTNAHETEAWGRGMVTPWECTERDFRWMLDCDLFVAFPGDPPSPGTHVEIGWATGLGRPVVVLLEENHAYAALVTGLPAVGAVHLVTYSDDPGFLDTLTRSVRALAHQVGATWTLDDPVTERAT